MKKAFCQCQKYKDPWYEHLDHVFRIRTKKKGLCGPDGIRVWGDRTHVYDVTLKGKTRNRYIDIMVSGITAEIVPELIAALEARYDRPGRVVAVLHTDEAIVHVHLLVPWTDTEGRAPRVKRGEWLKVDEEMAAITGHELTPRGQGRRRIETKRWEADPDSARRRALAMTERDRATLAQVERVISCYGAITTLAMRPGTGTEFLQENVKAIGELNLKQLRLLNGSGYTIGFGPAPDERGIQAIFLKDVPRGQLIFLPHDSLIVRTSQGSYQVHVLLDLRLVETEARSVRDWLAAKHGAASEGHEYGAALLPGFFEAGHSECPVEIAATAGAMPDFAYQDYLEELRREKAVKQRHEEAMRERHPAPYEATLQSIKKRWEDFYRGDAAAADFQYVLYLVEQGLKDSDIVHQVIMQSRHFVARKGTAAVSYVRQIIERSLEYLYGQDAGAKGEKTSEDPGAFRAAFKPGPKRS